MGVLLKSDPMITYTLRAGMGIDCPIGLCTKIDLEGRVLKSQTSNVIDGLPPAGRGGILRVTQNGGQ